jgi:heavy metal translocating P-type ATPase
MTASKRQPGCHLCGLPLPKAPQMLAEGGDKHAFCCNGCLHVYQILAATTGPNSDLRATALYRDCLAAGLIPGTPLANTGEADSAAPEHAAEAAEFTSGIEGMWCPSCAWVIEKVLRRTPGVLAATVDFFHDRLLVRYLPQQLGEAEIRRRVAGLGYRLRAGDGPDMAADREQLIRLGLAAILAANIMMLSMPLYGNWTIELGTTGLTSLGMVLLLLTTPVLFYCGWPILARGLRGLAGGNFTMDGLIAVGSLAAFGYSLAQMAQRQGHLYFDTAAMLITLVLLGRFLERRARAGLRQGLGPLQELTGKVRVLRAGHPVWLATAELRKGERFRVEAREMAPADGQVVAGSGEVDEAFLTGEARPLKKKPGDEVLAGSTLRHGSLELTATRVGPASSLGRMTAMVQEALQAKNRWEELADRLTRRFVPAIFLLATGTLAVLLLTGHGFAEALLRGLSVLIVSCPCALGIATPLAKVAILARARRQGIVVRNSAAFAEARHLDTLVFDKTGTVTEGSYRLRKILAPECGEAAALARAGALEAGAEHFLGRELHRLAGAAKEPELPAGDRCLHPGLGISGRVAAAESGIGSRQLMNRLGLKLPEGLAREAASAEAEGATVVFLGWEGEVRALFIFADLIRPGLAPMLAEFQSGGLEVHLLSGDSPATTAQVAARLGIANHQGGCPPEAKVAYIQALKQAGKRVGMIGDGFNDSGALAGADLGIAVGAGPSRLLAEGADLTLLGDPVQQLPEVQKLSQLLVTAIRGNLTFAVLYNALAIPLALLGLLNPLLAAVAMFASSLTVIGNTQRLAREGKVEVPGRQHGVLLTEALAEHQVTFPRFSGHRVRLQV